MPRSVAGNRGTEEWSGGGGSIIIKLVKRIVFVSGIKSRFLKKSIRHIFCVDSGTRE